MTARRTVTLNRDRWERVLEDAREMAVRIAERGWGEPCANQPGDLDDIADGTKQYAEVQEG